jgi:hypothetical protein
MISMVGAGAEGTTGGVQAGALLEAVLCYLYDIYGKYSLYFYSHPTLYDGIYGRSWG